MRDASFLDQPEQAVEIEDVALYDVDAPAGRDRPDRVQGRGDVDQANALAALREARSGMAADDPRPGD